MALDYSLDPLPDAGARCRQFAEAGFFVTEPLLDAEECRKIRAEFENDDRVLRLGEQKDGTLDYFPMFTVDNAVLETAARDPRLLEISMELLGGDLRLYWEQAVVKPPQARTELPWHQDNGYAPTDPPEYVTCWLALEDATLDNGCIHVVPGSHREGPVRHRMANDTFRKGYDGPDSDGVAVPVPAGAVLVFSSLAFHRSGPNVTDGSRWSWILQYCPAHAIHAETREPLTDRLLVMRGGVRLEPPIRERPIDVARVYAEWAEVDPVEA